MVIRQDLTEFPKKSLNMFSPHKNSYLQLHCGSINPRLLNRCVTKARDIGLPIDAYDFLPPFNRLTSEQPDIPIENIDVTRRPLAFGRLALPKLRRELHDKDPTVVLQAITSISDLVHDPEKGYEAIRLRIPDRLADLLGDNFPPVRERTALALAILAELADGRNAIVKNKLLLENLTLGLEDAEEEVRMKVATCLEMVARSWVAGDELVEHGFIESILNCLDAEQDAIILVHLETLASLMYGEGKCIALKLNAFKTFLGLLGHNSPDVQSGALDCLMILTSTPTGKKMAMDADNDVLKHLNRLLNYGNNKVRTSAASVLTFCTIKTKAKVLSTAHKNMARRLIRLAHNPENVTLQMFCLKALTNICEHPMFRQEVLDRYVEEVRTMQVGCNYPYKNTLLRILNWVPYVIE